MRWCAHLYDGCLHADVRVVLDMPPATSPSGMLCLFIDSLATGKSFPFCATQIPTMLRHVWPGMHYACKYVIEHLAVT